MPRGEPGSAVGPTRILVSAETLFEHGVDAPRPLGDASAAIERLGWIGQPVVTIGEHIAGCRLPSEPNDRIGWVRMCLGTPDIPAAVFDDPAVDRASEAAERAAVESWSLVGNDWHADRLLTGRDSSVGPARKAGLTVVRIGPRAPVPSPGR